MRYLRQAFQNNIFDYRIDNDPINLEITHMTDPIKKMLFFSVLVLASHICAFAQYVPMNTRINTPYGPATIKTYQYVPNNQNYNYNYGTLNLRQNFSITLKNDSIIDAKAKIVYDQINWVKGRNNGVKFAVKPSETKEINVINLAGRPMKGIPTDSCWLFLTTPGKINLYSQKPVENDLAPSALQLEDGEIMVLNKANLLAMVSGNSNPKIDKLIDKGRLQEAIYEFNTLQKDQTNESEQSADGGDF